MGDICLLVFLTILAAERRGDSQAHIGSTTKVYLFFPEIIFKKGTKIINAESLNLPVRRIVFGAEERQK